MRQQSERIGEYAQLVGSDVGEVSVSSDAVTRAGVFQLTKVSV
jgi:hypothetical protein